MERRTFLHGIGAAGWSFSVWPRHSFRRSPFHDNPFTLGVASGDPAADGAVLWTRLAPSPLEDGGGMAPEPVDVEWRIAGDEGMRNVVQRGTAVAAPELGHSVHVELRGLEPHRWYWYQFSTLGEESAVGRLRTAPPGEATVNRLNFVFASCNHYEQGLFTAFRHLSEEDIDLIVHLGDYIYEGAGQPGRVRQHAGAEIFSLDDYRRRYAQYKSDPNLQLAHAAAPWVVTWDDHEVDNDYAAAISENADPTAAFLARRASAYQAYYEHMPLRATARPRGPDLRLYRTVPYGALATFHVLDTRQYRSDQVCEDSGGVCPEVAAPDRTMLGEAQARWLRAQLDASDAQWNVLAQQVMMAMFDLAPGPTERHMVDKWQGYLHERAALISDLRDRRVANPIVLTGDIHSNWVTDVKVANDQTGPTVATEFVGTSISSGGDGAPARNNTGELLAENPVVRYYNGQRGYVHCSVTPQSWQADYRVMDFVTRPGGRISTHASFLVESGRAGAVS